MSAPAIVGPPNLPGASYRGVPTSISQVDGLIGYWRADTGVSVASGDLTWSSLAGTGGSLAGLGVSTLQFTRYGTTSGNSPTQNLTGVNGKPSIYFNGASSQALKCNALAQVFATTADYCVIIAYQLDNLSAAVKVMGYASSSSSTASYGWIAPQTTGAVEHRRTNDSAVNIYAVATATTAVEANVPFIDTWIHQRASMNYLCNGVSPAAATTFTYSALQGSNQVTIGCECRNSTTVGGGYMTGHITHVVVLNTVPDDATLNMINQEIASYVGVYSNTVFISDPLSTPAGSNANLGWRKNAPRATAASAVGSVARNREGTVLMVTGCSNESIPFRCTATLDYAAANNISVRAEPGTTQYIYGSTKFTSGWTNTSGDIWSQTITAPTNGTLLYCTTRTGVSLDPVNVNQSSPITTPQILVKNTGTPTTPSAGQWGTSAGVVYVNLGVGISPNSNTIEVPIANGYFLASAPTTTGPVVSVGDDNGAGKLWGKFFDNFFFLSTGASTTARGKMRIYGQTVAEYTGNAGFGGNNFFSFLECYGQNVRASFSSNDGFNAHCDASFVNNSDAGLLYCNGVTASCNGDEGISIHEYCRLDIVGGLIFRNSSGGTDNINQSRVTVGGGAWFDRNNQRYSWGSTQVATETGQISGADSSSTTVDATVLVTNGGEWAFCQDATNKAVFFVAPTALANATGNTSGNTIRQV